VKLSSLGDLFHSLPVVHNLKVELGATVDWVTQPEYVDVVRCFPDVSRVISFPRREFASKGFSFIRERRAERYEYVVDLQGLLKSALVSKWARGIRRIGPSYSREGAHFFYTDIAGPKNKDRHAVDEALDVVSFLNLEMLEPKFPLAFPEAKLEEPSPRVAMVSCSRWRTKDWPPAHFAETGRILRERFGASIFLIGGPSDQEVCQAIEDGIPDGVTNLCGRTSLVELGGVLAAMDLVIAVDSGPMHMAAAIGTPVLAIFGPTNPECVGPYGDMHRVVTAERPPCWPDRNRSCPACLAAIAALPVEKVTEAAADMLS